MSTRKVSVIVAQAIRQAGMRVAVQTNYRQREHLSITDNITGDDIKIFVVGPEETAQVPAKLDLVVVEIPWVGFMSKRAPSRVYGFFEISSVLGMPVATYNSYGDIGQEKPPLSQVLESLGAAQISVNLCQFSETARHEYPLLG